MTINIAINGFGRIGRNVFRANYEQGFSNDIKVVAINDLGNADINAHLLKYDSTHGNFSKKVNIKDDKIVIDNKDEVLVLSEKDPSKLPWEKLNIDVVKYTGNDTLLGSDIIRLLKGKTVTKVVEIN